MKPNARRLVLVLSIAIAALSPAKAEEAGGTTEDRLESEIRSLELLRDNEQSMQVDYIYRALLPRVDRLCTGVEFCGRLRRILLNHREKTVKLVQQDLNGNKAGDIWRAAETVRRLGLAEAYEVVARCFCKQSFAWNYLSNSRRALVKNLTAIGWERTANNLTNTISEQERSLRELALTLAVLKDERAIALLLRKDPLNPGAHRNSLRILLSRNKAHKEIIRYLRARDPHYRRFGAYCLGHCDDPILVPEVKRLLRDSDTEVRLHAVDMAFRLSRHDPSLVERAGRLLSDKDSEIRVTIAEQMASRDDPICARPLLDLLEDPSVQGMNRFRVVHAIQHLAGTDFGYEVAENDKARHQAVAAFKEWILKQTS